MTDIPNWDEVEEKIKPIAISTLEDIQESLRDEGLTVSEIGDAPEAGGILWDITVETPDEITVVSFSVVDSTEYEGEMLGYNVSLDVVREGGQVIGSYTPYNYTDDVWTTDLSELVSRAEETPILSRSDLQ